MAQAMIDFQKFSEFQSSQSKDREERDMQTLMSTFSGEPTFFQDDNDVPKNIYIKPQNQATAIQR